MRWIYLAALFAACVECLSENGAGPKCRPPRLTNVPNKRGHSYSVKKQKTEANGHNIVKKQHKVNGVRVMDSQYVEDDDRKGKKSVHSQLLDVPDGVNTVPAHTLQEAVDACLVANGYAPGTGEPRKHELVIKFDEDACEFKLTWYVANFIGGSQPTQPACFVQDSDLAVLRTWNDIDHLLIAAKGGNAKVSWDFYGPGATPDPATTVRTSLPLLDVTSSGGTSCQLSNAWTETWSWAHGTSSASLVVFPNCLDGFNYSDIQPNPTHAGAAETNQAVNVEADAQAFGTATFHMYQAYTGGPPLETKLINKVHYDTGYENAFYSGGVMNFGDGATTFYPLVCMDVMAHEVSHGYTELNSGLVYDKQSGGMNEAYSDIAGEAAEFFFYGTNDFKTGADIMKPPRQALRWLSNPPLDGASIDHVNDYSDGLNVHYSSGVYNKAFFNLATNPRWSTKHAFQAFQLANRWKWTELSNFQNGAEGVFAAVVDKQWNAEDVQKAFAPTGIFINPSLFSYVNEVISLAAGASTKRTVTLTLAAIGATSGLRVSTSGGSGDPDVYVSLSSSATINVNTGSCSNCLVKGITSGQESVVVKGSYAKNTVFYITLGAFSAISGVRLQVEQMTIPNPSLTKEGLLCTASSECASNSCVGGTCVPAAPTSPVPTASPTSRAPTGSPSTRSPTLRPTTRDPTPRPTRKPTYQPTKKPTKRRTG